MAQLPPLSQAATLSHTDAAACAEGVWLATVAKAAEAARVSPTRRLRAGWVFRAAECFGVEYIKGFLS